MGSGKEKAEQHKQEGNNAFRGRDFQKAVKEFTAAISTSPNDHVLFSNRSAANASLLKFDEALEDARKCIELAPEWAKGYTRKGLAEFKLGLLIDAESSYQRSVELDCSNTAALEGLEELKREEAKARRQLLSPTVLQRFPQMKKNVEEDSKFVLRVLGLLLALQRDPKTLRTALYQPDTRLKEGLMALMGIFPDEDGGEASPPRRHPPVPEKPKEPEVQLTPEEKEAEELKEKGNAFYKQRKFDEALSLYDKAIEKNPKELLYRNNKAAVYLEQKEFEKCIAECNEALSKRYEVKADFAKVAKILSRLAVCYTKMGDFDNAILHYEKSLMEDNNRHTRVALAETQRQKEKAEKEAYQDPVKAEEHREKGNAFFKQCNYPEAKKEYDEAIRRNPNAPVLYSNRAATLMKLFEFPSALKDCDMAVELDKSFSKGWARKGNCHMAMKEMHKAMMAFEKGLEVDPNSRECMEGKQNALMNLSRSQQSDVDEEQLRHAMADPEIQNLLRDPMLNMVLKNAQEDPKTLQEALKDPQIKGGLEKLIMAGIVRIG